LVEVRKFEQQSGRRFEGRSDFCLSLTLSALTIQTYFTEHYRKDLFFGSKQEQNTAVDGWNEQISQLTAECDQLKDSLQEVTKVLASTFFFLLYSLSTSNFHTSGKLYSYC